MNEISITEINGLLGISPSQSSILRQYCASFPKPTPSTAQCREKRYYLYAVMKWKSKNDVTKEIEAIEAMR